MKEIVDILQDLDQGVPFDIRRFEVRGTPWQEKGSTDAQQPAHHAPPKDTGEIVGEKPPHVQDDEGFAEAESIVSHKIVSEQTQYTVRLLNGERIVLVVTNHFQDLTDQLLDEYVQREGSRSLQGKGEEKGGQTLCGHF